MKENTFINGAIRYKEENRYDDKGSLTHCKDSDGYEYWNEYDDNGRCIVRKDSMDLGMRYMYDDNGNMVHCIHYQYSQSDSNNI